MAGPAFAQPAPPQGPAPGGGDWAAHRAQWQQMRQQHEQERMTDLHTVLRIHPDQEAAFQAFAASMQPRAHEHHDWAAERQGMGSMTTPQMLDRMEARKTAHEAEQRQHIDAVKRFYAALSPEQQQVFDALHRLAKGRHGGWGGHEHGDHGMGEHGDAQG